MTIKQGNVILNPSLSVILSVAKNLVVSLRVNSVKNLIKSINYETLRFAQGDKNMDFSNPS